MLYHSAVPEATQATYGEFNNVDFVLNVGPGRSLMRNSVRLNGNVLVTTDGTARPAGGVYMVDLVEVLKKIFKTMLVGVKWVL